MYVCQGVAGVQGARGSPGGRGPTGDGGEQGAKGEQGDQGDIVSYMYCMGVICTVWGLSLDITNIATICYTNTQKDIRLKAKSFPPGGSAGCIGYKRA